MLASGDFHGAVRLWDPRSGGLLHVCNTPGNMPVATLAFAPSGMELVSTHADNKVYLWDSATGKLKRTLASDGAMATALAFAPDGPDLAIRTK